MTYVLLYSLDVDLRFIFLEFTELVYINSGVSTKRCKEELKERGFTSKQSFVNHYCDNWSEHEHVDCRM